MICPSFSNFRSKWFDFDFRNCWWVLEALFELPLTRLVVWWLFLGWLMVWPLDLWLATVWLLLLPREFSDSWNCKMLKGKKRGYTGFHPGLGLHCSTHSYLHIPLFYNYYVHQTIPRLPSHLFLLLLIQFGVWIHITCDCTWGEDCQTVQNPWLEHTGALGVQSCADLQDPGGASSLSDWLGPASPYWAVHWHQPHLLHWGASVVRQSELEEHCWPATRERRGSRGRRSMAGESIIRESGIGDLQRS